MSGIKKVAPLSMKKLEEEKKKEENREKEKSRITWRTRILFIIFYTFVTVSWALVMFRVINFSIQPRPRLRYLWAKVSTPLLLAQTLSFIDHIFQASGHRHFVRSDHVTSLTTSVLRMMICWCLLYVEPVTANSFTFVILIVLWSICDMISFGYTTLSFWMSSAPYWMKWIRYSVIVICFPIMAGTEVTFIWNSISHDKILETFTLSLPNEYNFAFNARYFLFLTILLYYPYIIITYLNIISIRQRRLYRPRKAVGNKKLDSIHHDDPFQAHLMQMKLLMESDKINKGISNNNNKSKQNNGGESNNSKNVSSSPLASSNQSGQNSSQGDNVILRKRGGTLDIGDERAIQNLDNSVDNVVLLDSKNKNDGDNQPRKRKKNKKKKT